MYKYLLIDLDDTIFDFKLSEKKAIISTLKLYGISIDLAETKLFSEINEEFFLKFQNKELTRNEFHYERFKKFLGLYNIHCDYMEADKKYMEFLSNGYDLITNASSTLLALKDRYKLYALTNGIYSVQISRLKSAGIYNLFTDIFVSDVIGANKPDNIVMDYVMNKVNDKNKSNYLIIGDRENSDVMLGVNTNVDSCLISSKKSSLATYNINNIDELLMLL